MEKPVDQAAPILSSQSLANLTARLRAARREMCEHDECDCITNEEHERNLARPQ